MINLKRLFNTALMVSCIASLNASSHVCSVNPASLTIIGGAHILYPVHSESKIWGIGGGLDLYVSRANKFGMHAAGQIAYMSDGDFDLGTSYDVTNGAFSKANQGGLKDISMSGRISMGKETIFSHEDSNYLQRRGEDCLCTRLYTGLGVALEGNRFKSKDGAKGAADKFTIDKLNSYSIIPGIDLRLFYVMDTVVISPEIFVGPSVYGRGNYTVAYTTPTKTGSVKTSQDIGASVYAAIPLIYKMSENGSAGIRLSFKGNYRDEKIKTPLPTPTDTAGKLGGIKDKVIDEPLSENIGGAISIQFTYINM